jgi:lipoprotein-anchoring transpeptidase ErfK/SrfK
VASLPTSFDVCSSQLLSADPLANVRARASILACLLLAAAGCGARTTASPPATAGAAAAPASKCRSGYRALRYPGLAYAAIVRRHAEVDRRPGGRTFARFGRININGVPMVFGVLGVRQTSSCSPVWYRVQVPVRPNGTTGWVRAREVTLARVRTRVVVDLSARRLTLYRGRRRVLTAPVAIGSPATPTPTGRYYVNQRLIPTDPNGPFGPGAVGISAFSDVLTGWAQGGPIAIHGTDAPWSVGRAVSNGCIRLHNAVLRRVFAAALAGTPVLIHG